MSNSNNDNKHDSFDQHDDEPKQIPYRRERTPSIVVQSLGLSFKKDSNITGSIELPADDDDDGGGNDASPQDTSEASDPKSSTSGPEADDANSSTLAGIEESGRSSTPAKGSLSSLQNSSNSPVNAHSTSSPIRASRPSPLHLTSTSRRLSLNIGSTAPRRQSLTVDGLSSASFINPALKEGSYPGGNATGSLRNKVALKPGHSLMGWIKLASTAKDLAGTGGKIIEVSPEELAKHDKVQDCWVALKGNVYNVTKYLNYHPGGVDELMRGAGRDATELFNEVHRWVNYESILAKCLVGPYKLDSPLTPVGRATFHTITNDQQQQQQAAGGTPSSSANCGGGGGGGSSGRRDPTVAQKPNRRQSIALTVPSPNKYQSLLLNNNSTSNLNQIQQPPTYVIMQDKSCIKLKIQDLTLNWIRSRHLICDLNDNLELHTSIILSPDWLYRIHLRLDQQVDPIVSTDLTAPAGAITTGANDEISNSHGNNKTITIQLHKREQSIWNRIGTSLGLNDSLCEMTLADKYFRPCSLVSKKQLTHDTYLFEFELKHALMFVPIGWHVLLREYSPVNKQKQETNNSNDQYYYEDTRIYKNYTPVLPSMLNNDGLTDETGFMKQFYFIIKIYPDGVLTSKLNLLKIGDKIDISDYQCVDFDIEQLVKTRTLKHWILLAAGTGITPFCRTMSYILAQGDDSIESVTLVFFNKTQNDIILREQFDELAKNHARFRVAHVLSQEQQQQSKWTGKRGKISKDLLAEFVDSKSPDELQILACGPRAFTQLTKSIVNELNLSEKLYVFHG